MSQGLIAPDNFLVLHLADSCGALLHHAKSENSTQILRVDILAVHRMDWYHYLPDLLHADCDMPHI